MHHFNIEPSIHPARLRSDGRTRTDLTNAILTGADLRGVDLRDVRGLTPQQLQTARIDASTQLPLSLRFGLTIQRLARWLRNCRHSAVFAYFGLRH
jgi:hypothetical protein